MGDTPLGFMARDHSRLRHGIPSDQERALKGKIAVWRVLIVQSLRFFAGLRGRPLKL